MSELKSLSKLKNTGKLRYWRGTIEMPESELHAICDEIQAEHDHAIAATLGSGTCEMANALLRKSETAKIERIEQLESLVRDMWHEMATCPDYATPPYRNCNICEQICNLGIEVGELVRCRDCMYLEVMPRRCMVCGHWDRCEKRPRMVLRDANGKSLGGSK